MKTTKTPKKIHVYVDGVRHTVSPRFVQPMNPELKAKWLEALRSGDYLQTTGRLVRRNFDNSRSYCCLGVMCDVMANNDMKDVDGYPIKFLSYGNSFKSGISISDTLPVTPVGQAAFDGPAPLFDIKVQGQKWRNDVSLGLHTLNDQYRFTFAQLARVIEAFL